MFDLRSDTVTKPSKEILESALDAELGDDEYKTPAHNPETMQTNIEGIYLAGVICGGLKTNKWFIENSRDHASIIFSNIK